MRRARVTLLLAVVALAGGLRWAVMEWRTPITLVGDERYYVGVAANLAREGVARFEDSRALRPPAHPFVLSLLWPAGADGAPPDMAALHRLLLLEVALGTVVVWLTILLGEALFDLRTGLVAGLGAALFPNLVVFSHYLWSENLYAVLLLGGLLVVVRGRGAAGIAPAAAAGVLFGVGALTRETTLLTAAMAALWWVATAAPPDRRRALAKGALLCTVAVACVVPWIARNYRVLGRLVPVSTIGWFAAGEGNCLETPNWMRAWGPRRAGFKGAYMATSGELARMDFARHYALERIAAEQPAWIFKKLVRSSTQLFTPDSPLLYKIRMGAYGAVTPTTVRLLAAVTGVPCMLAFLAGTLGIAAARGRGRLLLPCLVIGSTLTVHVLTAATIRYRMPMIPLFLIYAAPLVVARRATLASMTRRRWLGVAVVWAFYAGICVPYSADLRAAFF